MVSIGNCVATGDIAIIRRSLGCRAIWDTVWQARHLNDGWGKRGLRSGSAERPLWSQGSSLGGSRAAKRVIDGPFTWAAFHCKPDRIIKM